MAQQGVTTQHSVGKAPPGAWAAVAFMIVGFAVLAVAVVTQVIWVGVLGAVLGLIGIVLGKVFHLMEHTH